MAATTESNPASGAGLELSHIREAAFGVTPAVTPSLTRIRSNPFQMSPSVEMFTSSEINALRVVKALRKVYTGPVFSFGGEVSYGNFDAMLEAVMMDEWTTDALEEGSTFLSHTLQGKFADASTVFYKRITGAVMQGLSINMDGTGANAVQAQFTGIGKTFATATTDIDADGADAAPTGDPMVAAECAIEIDDAAATIVSLGININPSLEALRAIGNKGPAHIAPNGNRTVTGQLVAYLEDRSWIQKIEDETPFKIEAFLRDAGASFNEYALTLATVKASNVQVSQDNGPLRVTVDWQAYSASGASTLAIARTAAA